MDHVGTVSYSHAVVIHESISNYAPCLAQENSWYKKRMFINLLAYHPEFMQLHSFTVAVWYPKGLKQRNHETKTEA